MADLVREDLRGRSPYGAPQRDVPVQLNTNENPYPVPPSVTAAIADAIGARLAGLNRYPDPDATGLREDLAGYLGRWLPGLTASRVWAGNGSNEVTLHLLQAFGGPGRTALGFTPGYSLHPLLARTTGTGWRDGAREPDFGLTAAGAAAQVRRLRPDLVLICSPNNPTGTAVDLAVVDAVLAEAPGLVVVDEAYAEFARPGSGTALTRLDRHPRLVVTRTMSKAFGFAGGRLGYLAADPAVVEALRLVRLPYHLSTITQAAARAALAHADTLLAVVGAVVAERDRMITALRGRGLTVAPSDTNFVLFGGLPDQAEVWHGLVERGVLIRDVGLPGWLRVTAGTPEQTDAFLSALDAVLAGDDGDQPGERRV